MADESNNNGHQRGDRSVEVRVSAQLENLAVVRTVVAAIGTFEDLDFDAVSDLRLAVDEACTRLIRSAMPDSTLVLVVDPRESEVVVEASTTCKSQDILTPGSFSWHVLSSLTDEVTTFHDGQGAEEGRLFGISMTTRRASSLQVSPRSTKGSSRSNSEYADVAEMFRELEGMPGRLGEVPATARPHRRALPAAGRPHRPPIRRAR